MGQGIKTALKLGYGQHPPSKGKAPYQPWLPLQYHQFLASSSSRLDPGEGLVAES